MFYSFFQLITHKIFISKKKQKNLLTQTLNGRVCLISISSHTDQVKCENPFQIFISAILKY